MSGRLYIVGIGPGDAGTVTKHAAKVLALVDVIVGYEGYTELVRAWLPQGHFIASPITHEVERAEDAVRRAEGGQTVALIGSGDAGVYGLAGMALEILAGQDSTRLRVEVLPGVTAATSVAALLGAPLGHDFAVISLSDLLTPWKVIRRRLEAAAEADFVTVLYNPASARRRWQLDQARAIFLRFRAAETPVGLVRDAHRPRQQVILSSLESFDASTADMLTTVVIGNTSTFRWRDLLITPRGYKKGEVDPGGQPD